MSREDDWKVEVVREALQTYTKRFLVEERPSDEIDALRSNSRLGQRAQEYVLTLPGRQASDGDDNSLGGATLTYVIVETARFDSGVCDERCPVPGEQRAHRGFAVGDVPSADHPAEPANDAREETSEVLGGYPVVHLPDEWDPSRLAATAPMISALVLSATRTVALVALAVAPADHPTLTSPKNPTMVVAGSCCGRSWRDCRKCFAGRWFPHLPCACDRQLARPAHTPPRHRFPDTWSHLTQCRAERLPIEVWPTLLRRVRLCV